MWIALLFLLSFWKKLQNKKRKLRWIAVICFLVFGNHFLYYKTTKLLYLPDTIVPKKHYDYTIVLGGILEKDEKHNQINFNDNADRWLHACFNHQVISDTIIFTSGSGKLSRPNEREALLLQDFWSTNTHFKFESRSRNTFENAKFSKPLIHKDSANVLLITSASHMRRAAACFENQNIHVDLLSVDYDNAGNFTLVDYLIPQAKVFYLWEGTLHEYLGILTYKFKGYIE